MGTPQFQNGWIDFYRIDRPAIVANSPGYVIASARSDHDDTWFLHRKPKGEVVRALVDVLQQEARMTAEESWCKVDNDLVAHMIHVDLCCLPLAILEAKALYLDLLIRGPDIEMV